MASIHRTATAWFLFALAAVPALAQRTPDEALRALQEGNRRFAADKSVAQPLGEGVRRTLARGQSPSAVVLCCSDSRVPPEHVFNAGLGELFVIRVAGHTCDPETLASLEYAVDHLNVPLCIVLGHEGCGAVAATVAQVAAQDGQHPEPAASPALQNLLEEIEPAVRKIRQRDLGGKELTDACEEENAQRTATECLRRSPMLRRYAQVGRFKILAARYHLQSGEVEWLPPRPLPPEADSKAPPLAHGAAPMGLPPHVALRMLQAGHRRFLGDGAAAGDLSANRREQLTHGQHPLAIVLTCSDSRVAPEHVFDAGLGELFVVRVAGNTLNDDALASVEYAASHTGASLLVVMGHTRCGAITAATEHPEGQQLSPSMRVLLARLEPAVEKARHEAGPGRDLVELAVRGNVQRVVAEARSRSAILRQLEGEGRFAMLPVVYDLASGDLTWLKDAAEPAAEAAPPAAPGGETKHRAPEAGEAHGAPAGHGAPAEHGEPAAEPHGLPTIDMSDPPAAERLAKPEQGTEEAVHGEGHGTNHTGEPAHAAHGGAHPDSGHEAPEGHGDAHGEPSHSTSEPADSTGWSDPIVLVGLGGVASLLLAALVAVLKK